MNLTEMSEITPKLNRERLYPSANPRLQITSTNTNSILSIKEKKQLSLKHSSPEPLLLQKAEETPNLLPATLKRSERIENFFFINALDLPFPRFCDLFSHQENTPVVLQEHLLAKEDPFWLHVLRHFQKLNFDDSTNLCASVDAPNMTTVLFHFPYLKAAKSLFETGIGLPFVTLRQFLSFFIEKIGVHSMSPLHSSSSTSFEMKREIGDKKRLAKIKFLADEIDSWSLLPYFIGTTENEESIEGILMSPSEKSEQQLEQKKKQKSNFKEKNPHCPFQFIPSHRPLIRFLPWTGVIPFENEDLKFRPCFVIRSIFVYDCFRITEESHALKVQFLEKTDSGHKNTRESSDAKTMEFKLYFGPKWNRQVHHLSSKSFREVAWELLQMKHKNPPERRNFYVGSIWYDEKTQQLWAQIGIIRRLYIEWNGLNQKFLVQIKDRQLEYNTLPELMDSLQDKDGCLKHKAYRLWENFFSMS